MVAAWKRDTFKRPLKLSPEVIGGDPSGNKEVDSSILSGSTSSSFEISTAYRKA